MEKIQAKQNSEENKKKSVKKKTIVAVLLLGFAFGGSFLIYFILQITLNTDTPMVVVVSGSMEPNIHQGDLLFVKGTDPNNIEAGSIEEQDGDVIVFDARGLWSGAPDEPIVHRVVDKWKSGGKWYFLTKGDHNPGVDDAPVPEDRVIGVVVGRIPYIGWVKIFLTDTGLFIPIMVILAALLTFSIVLDIIKPEEEREEKTKNKRRNAKVKPPNPEQIPTQEDKLEKFKNEESKELDF